jgi:hypothetical protein
VIGTVLPLSRRRLLRWCLALGILGLAVATVVHSATTGGDFRLSIWYPGQAMFHGRDPYDIASFERYYGVHQVEAFSKGWFPLYGPVRLWLAVFFGLFPVKVASGIWFVANLAGLGAIAFVVARALDRRLGGRPSSSAWPSWCSRDRDAPRWRRARPPFSTPCSPT